MGYSKTTPTDYEFAVERLRQPDRNTSGEAASCSCGSVLADLLDRSRGDSSVVHIDNLIDFGDDND